MSSSSRGKEQRRPRVAACPPGPPPTTGPPADWASGFSVTISDGDPRDAEALARAAWEGAQAVLRWFFVVGWRHGLRLRLGSLSSPDHVLGWKIVRREPDGVTLEAASRLLRAHNSFERQGERLVWATYVNYRSALGRVVWLLTTPLHRRLAPIALARAAHAVVVAGAPDMIGPEGSRRGLAS